MGSVTLKVGGGEHGPARFKRSPSTPSLQLLLLLSLLLTNLFALYAFTSSSPLLPPAPNFSSLVSLHVSLILRQISSSQKLLSQMERDLVGFDVLDPSRPGLPPDLPLFLRPHPLPLGQDARSGITEMVSSVGHSCAASLDLLSRYMNYTLAADCPAADAPLARKLVARGCDPLPRRRCFARSPPKPALLPFPASLWRPVSDKLLGWVGFPCKSFKCYNAKNGGADFDLAGNGLEKQRWVKPRGKNDFLADDVLAMAGGAVRIGFDVDGGSGHFAAVMADRNVTVITSTLDQTAPFNEFVAARGLFPLSVSSNQRFPFYDGVFDLVHIGTSALGDGSNIVGDMLEFFMFDVDRVLRAKGLLWLDNYYCAGDENKRTITRLVERFAYRKLRWVVGEKKVEGSDIGRGRPQIYLSAVLEKPVRG